MSAGSRTAPPPGIVAFGGVFAVTLLGLLAIGITLPVLPRYVRGPLGSGDLEVGIVTGAFAITGLACRPIAGHFADRGGRKRIVILGSLLSAIAGALYFVPAGVPGLIVARLFLGAGEGLVYTAGSAWVVDMAPVQRRGRVIGLYGLAIWGGLALGPPIGDLALRAASFEAVWALAAGAPLLGVAIAARIPATYRPRSDAAFERRLISHEALGPGLALALAIVGYAAMAAFVVLHLDARGIGHGPEVFTAFAASVVAMRILAGGLPDRFGAVPSAVAAATLEAAGLAIVALAGELWVAVAGAVAMGAGFSLLFPSLALIVVNRVPEERRALAMGTFTAFFDLGVGAGATIAGVVAALAGYPAAFAFAATCALASAGVALGLRRRPAGV